MIALRPNPVHLLPQCIGRMVNNELKGSASP
jgi:hypothetical protein